MQKILNNSSIWDLHIHSCNSPKSSGDFQKMNVKTYVDKLLEIFKDYSGLSMISFTDHNVISYDVYKEFYSRKSNIELIPGIEIDVDIDDISDSKHLIFYFNVDESKLEEISIKINNLLKGKKSIKMDLCQLFRHIFSNKFLSPYLNLFQFPFDNQKYFY